jgi:hypothetical protein
LKSLTYVSAVTRPAGVLTGLSALVGLSFWSLGRADDPRLQTNPAATPVEPDMHEFMEYMFEPTFKRLKAGLASEPVDNKAWAGVKSDALILAEGGNLLLMRRPDQDIAAWNQHAANVRALGGDLYAAAKKKDFSQSRKHYEAMLTKCNACHTQFAEGEHLLSP